MKKFRGFPDKLRVNGPAIGPAAPFGTLICTRTSLRDSSGGGCLFEEPGSIDCALRRDDRVFDVYKAVFFITTTIDVPTFNTQILRKIKNMYMNTLGTFSPEFHPAQFVTHANGISWIFHDAIDHFINPCVLLPYIRKNFDREIIIFYNEVQKFIKEGSPIIDDEDAPEEDDETEEEDEPDEKQPEEGEPEEVEPEEVEPEEDDPKGDETEEEDHIEAEDEGGDQEDAEEDDAGDEA
uniref:Uncharacterized protein n=1 Tax=Tetranychus urticae TaxID=32264 RepID=T1KP15_TETUR